MPAPLQLSLPDRKIHPDLCHSQLPRVQDLVGGQSFLPATLGGREAGCGTALNGGRGRDDGFLPTVATVVAGGEGFLRPRPAGRPAAPRVLIFVRMASLLNQPADREMTDHQPAAEGGGGAIC